MYLIKFATRFLIIIIAVGLLAAGCTNTKNTSTATTTSATTTPAEQNISTISYEGEDGKSSLEILKSKYPTETKEYPGVGEFVQSINGVTADSTQFWAFYLNGASSNVGAGQYITKSTDKIEWRLEEIKQ